MKPFKIILLIIAVLFISTKLHSQALFGIECGTVSNNSEQISSPFYGLYKTIRTDTAYNGVTPSAAVFPVIIVFVQFKNDFNYSDWKTDSAPSYYSTMIAQIKPNYSNWWEAYNSESESISSYWAEVSRGKLHIIGNAYSIVLDSDVNYYNSLGNQVAEITINAEIWQKLDGYIQDWSAYDKWSYTSVNSEIKFIYQKDNKIDMIYKIHKSVGSCLANFDGYSQLINNPNNNSGYYIVQDSIYIHYCWGCGGSGLTVSRLHKKNDIIGTLTHEHGHYLYASGHLVHGKMVYICGFDYFYSPYEMILNGYMKPRYGSYGNYESLGDYSSRNAGDGEILKVRIDSVERDEYFLIANRRKESKWDRVMLGDTTKYDVTSESNYGKGIYIYHIFNGIQDIINEPTISQDLECADGIWAWTNLGKIGTAELNCWTGYNFYQFRRDSVIYEQDQVSLSTGENIFKCDGVSLNYRYYDSVAGINKYTTNIFGMGQRPANNCLLGTDRIYTNSEEYYTNNENMGDRWDAWNIDYNEMFSPYSSPNTNNYSNNVTGIFIWYDSLNGNTAYIRIYRTSANTPLDSILKWTPPSRPMGLKVDVTDCINYRRYPVLTWNQNMEPDMEQSGTKRYKIFRAWDAMENVPGNFEEIADTLFDADTNIATFIDYSTYAQCDDGTAEENYRLRYKVMAVDIYEDISVYSDFVSITTYELDRGEGGDAIHHKNLIYELSQNYPNPFNPITNIQYSIPINGFVKLTVYDILGREVKNLINEFKHAGSYFVSFDGSTLSSGIYFYRLKSGNFVQVKRMIILK